MDINMDLHFVIIATGYNCEDKVKKCVQSIRAQTYANWDAIIIDDGSEDRTGLEIWKHTKSHKFYPEMQEDNQGAAKRRFDAIRFHVAPESVVVLIGLDDELLPNALERIKQEYDNGKLMTYGNWIGSDGYTLPEGFLQYSEEIHRARYYRSVQFRATAVNTFKAHLFLDHFTEDDFKFNGEWIKATTESNLMFSLLEMCGQSRIGVIEEPIYLYNNQRKDSAAKRFGREYQDKILKDAKKRPMRELI